MGWVLNHFGRVQLLATPWTVAHQAHLSMAFSRQEYWSGLPGSPPRDLPNPGMEPTSLMSPALAGGFFTTSSRYSGSAPNPGWQATKSELSAVADAAGVPGSGSELPHVLDAEVGWPFCSQRTGGATGWSAGAWLAGVLALNQEPGGSHTGDAPAARSSLEEVPPPGAGGAPWPLHESLASTEEVALAGGRLLSHRSPYLGAPSEE